MTKLWSYNKITGYWVMERECSTDTAHEWLAIFQNDEPAKKFKISKNKPR